MGPKGFLECITDLRLNTREKTGRLGQLGCQLAPITDPNRRTTDPTDSQPTMSTWCPPISRVLNPFPALVCPSSKVLGPVLGRKRGHLTWVMIPRWGQNLAPNRRLTDAQLTPTDPNQHPTDSGLVMGERPWAMGSHTMWHVGVVGAGWVCVRDTTP